MYRSYFEGFLNVVAGNSDMSLFDPPCTPAAGTNSPGIEDDERADSVCIKQNKIYYCVNGPYAINSVVS